MITASDGTSLIVSMGCDEVVGNVEQDIVVCWEKILSMPRRDGVEWDAEMEAGLDEIKSLRRDLAKEKALVIEAEDDARIQKRAHHAQHAAACAAVARAEQAEAEVRRLLAWIEGYPCACPRPTSARKDPDT